MKRALLEVAMAVALISVGWSVGKAQARVADFEIAIDAPRGQVNVTCSRGCEWFQDGGTVQADNQLHLAMRDRALSMDVQRPRAHRVGHAASTTGTHHQAVAAATRRAPIGVRRWAPRTEAR